MENKNKLFIYGTLIDPEIQELVWGRKIKGTADILKGYKKSKIKIDGAIYPLIVLSKNGKVEGLVIKVTDDELKKIDKYETDSYKRIEVDLESRKSAWVYVKNY
ncbi:MAG: hypothetical protein A3I24_02500 [Candidatus Harrisonbacteria bacterium RIFCSPLOWO2_02_FULL_41_13b]|uniref:Putative gamma-glutamylcyclotransferase n=1 Tax=Candidatus Harrisonbacteria bacterium RIFCSPLOWO2_02_FULL_41_13b TaxID=1798409 RepID=A0A1G1ZW90_9BACT|nr:MAG: hypothetical protein A3J53_02445 [Candidatus Harrisonbacteria bacterium RIFCSPHIGHO2_02_FULL_40_20]OGY68117.1 MAG: hypothetical protein A3I24_02500 [Candidatus Harrisonbacteria bacterium RIFCSPLOWO2_02_FULL_41_13b]